MPGVVRSTADWHVLFLVEVLRLTRLKIPIGVTSSWFRG
jgi:hypothetical protein